MGDVRFAVSASKYAVSSLVASYSSRYPDVRIFFRTCSSVLGKELLKHGEIDFGFFLYPDDPQLANIPLYREPMELICASSHPLAKERVISRDALASYEFVTCIDGSDYNRLLNTYLGLLGIYKVKNSAQVEDGVMILRVVEEGGGVGYLAHSTVHNSLSQGKTIRLSVQDAIQPPDIEISIFFRQKTRLNKAAQAFLKYIYEETIIRYPHITMSDKQGSLAIG